MLVMGVGAYIEHVCKVIASIMREPTCSPYKNRQIYFIFCLLFKLVLQIK
jgi:hypothetical protein